MTMKGFLSYEELKKFIELVSQNPLLYDPTAKHSDIQSTKAVWTKIAAEMNVPSMGVTDWKSKWKCLRDTFVKKKREIRDAESQERIEKATLWRFYHLMTFLDPFVDRIVHKPVPRSNGLDYQHYTIIKNEEEGEEGDSGEEDGEDFKNKYAHWRRSADDSFKEDKKRKRYNQDYETDMNMTEMSSNPEEESDSWNADGSNSKSFFQSCSYRMDKLPDRVQSYLQLQISQLFFNAENPDVPPVPIMALPPGSS